MLDLIVMHLKLFSNCVDFFSLLISWTVTLSLRWVKYRWNVCCRHGLLSAHVWLVTAQSNSTSTVYDTCLPDFAPNQQHHCPPFYERNDCRRGLGDTRLWLRSSEASRFAAATQISVLRQARKPSESEMMYWGKALPQGSATRRVALLPKWGPWIWAMVARQVPPALSRNRLMLLPPRDFICSYGRHDTQTHTHTHNINVLPFQAQAVGF